MRILNYARELLLVMSVVLAAIVMFKTEETIPALFSFTWIVLFIYAQCKGKSHDPENDREF